MLELCTLASGSSGNCLLASDGTTHLLIDAGISARRICKSLRALGVEPAGLSGILITHEHSDHIGGLATLTKQLRLPVYASRGTALQLCYRIAFLEDVIHPFQAAGAFSIGSLGITSFPTPHDSADSVGYTLTDGRRKAAVSTDLGHLTPAVSAGIAGAHLLVCEANHDVEWLRCGPYPYFLKQRILGDRGHLSNEAGAALACAAVEGGAQTVVLAHLSAENNTPVRAYDTVHAALSGRGVAVGRDVTLEVAPRSEPGRRYCV
ncbi:MBL fold metallo-hydrolase [Flavonifractor sp. DFI.6.63]|uniref:MBL fold metallo-hydrolase n=1 Tax=Flavonifractor sp. DFI.6.63 TaxID=2963704 RepID=UPI00210B5990|nr:MBL fold metallo-hydrolase [Flavonifractor sp. DFI.6.63]MCQ5029656.1 MBL fold metallo-hydrolase [Flavonifractor sp. DFI.6.63]